MKNVSLGLMVLLYVAAGVNHFIHPEFYLQMMPPWLPLHNEIVFGSGVAEILVALLLIPPVTRNAAVVALILLLILIFPANVQMMVNYWHEGNPNTWATIARLPLQAVLIWWAWKVRNRPADLKAE